MLALEGRVVLARFVAKQAVTFAESGTDAVRAMALDELANVQFLASDFEQALGTFERARDLYAGVDDRHHLANVEGNIAACLMSLGRLGESEASYRTAIELARAQHDPAGESAWLVGLGRLKLESGRFAEAMALADDALRLAKPRQLKLSQFQAEWLKHLVIRRELPGEPDAARLNLLVKLYRHLRGHEGVPEIREFKQEVVLPARERGDPE